MFTLFRLVPKRDAIIAHVPVLVVSLLMAELFYTFGSFILQCLAFLATWFLVDLVVSVVRGASGESEPGL
ncbi:hypothetical protein F1188_15630 [Roseospira marina]|uniref:Uncharacterized protein n=1 Tax=Roseospira marina TaxID=140057 RepID=A0A5M6I8K1_9PROT|nr:hypothetical protein [Roseospira marina]KAA5604472.1 hypothetical protein F1188_15630 [Roseospira marina]MBB4315519.1 hypothetical protein [Roseospira marina]MBB5088544.1 hypothetical protein [Roseospira marina]